MCFTLGNVLIAVALVVCLQVAVRRTMAAGKGSGVQHLRNFTAEGKPVADPEDDKLWLSMESKHTLLEFDFARTWQQVRLRELPTGMGALSGVCFVPFPLVHW